MHVITDAGRSAEQVGRRGSQRRADFAAQVWKPSGGRVVLPGEPQSFLSRASTDWMRTTHIMNGDLLYSKSADVHADHILKMPPQ